jgi:hypothetical protein
VDLPLPGALNWMPLSQPTKLEVSLRAGVYQEHYDLEASELELKIRGSIIPSVEEIEVCYGKSLN